MPAQDFRAARAKQRLKVAELARLSDVSVPTILRIEDDERHSTIRATTLAKVRSALEMAGARFGADGTFHKPEVGRRGPADPFTISAARFRRARERTGLQPHDLIGLTGLTHPTLKAIERGKGPPRVARNTVLRMVEAYNSVGYRFCANPRADGLGFAASVASDDSAGLRSVSRYNRGMSDDDEFSKYYYEYDPPSPPRTPAEVLANLERLCGPMPEEFVRQFWERVEEWNVTRSRLSSHSPATARDQA